MLKVNLYPGIDQNLTINPAAKPSLFEKRLGFLLHLTVYGNSAAIRAGE